MLFLLICTLKGISQQKELSQLIKLHQVTVNEFDSLGLFKLNTNYHPDHEIGLLFQNSLQTDESKLRVFDEEIRMLKADPGISFKFYAQQNGNADFEEQEGIVKGTRVRAGFDWNVLKNGLVAKRNQIRLIENEKNLLEFDAQNKLRRQNYDLRHAKIIALFNQQKMQLLTQKISILKHQQKITESLFLAHYISKSKFLDIEAQLSRAKIELETYAAYNQSLNNADIRPAPLSPMMLPLLDIEYGQLFENIEANYQVENLLEIHRENIALTEKLKRQLSLNLNARWNYQYRETGVRSRSYPSLGISLSAPIRFKNSNDFETASFQDIQNEISVTIKSVQKECLNLYYEYQYKMKQYDHLLFQLEKRKEAIRVDRLNKGLELEENRLESFSLQTDVFDIRLEMCDIKSQSYLILSKIYYLSKARSVEEFTRVDVAQKAKNSHLIPVIQTEQLTETELLFFIDYLEKWNFPRVILFGENNFNETVFQKKISPIHLLNFNELTTNFPAHKHVRVEDFMQEKSIIKTIHAIDEPTIIWSVNELIQREIETLNQ